MGAHNNQLGVMPTRGGEDLLGNGPALQNLEPSLHRSTSLAQVVAHRRPKPTDVFIQGEPGVTVRISEFVGSENMEQDEFCAGPP